MMWRRSQGIGEDERDSFFSLGDPRSQLSSRLGLPLSICSYQSEADKDEFERERGEKEIYTCVCVERERERSLR